jgi:cysteine desulfurase
MKVYFDNAASTPMHPQVLEAMLPYLTHSYGNPSSIHAFGRGNKSAIELARKKIAALLKVTANEIYFCASGSEANNMALKLAVENLGVTRMISTKIEHKCVANSLVYLQEKYAIELVYLPCNEFGQISIDELEQVLQASPKKTLVSLMHIQNELGTMIDLQEIGDLCKKHEAFFHSDTVQSIGSYPLDFSSTNIDFFSASAHKFHGPLGVGFLYNKHKQSLGTWLHGGGHEKNLRSSTENVPGIVGMAKALDLSYENHSIEMEYIVSLKNSLKLGLKHSVPNIQFNEVEGESTYKILSATFPPNFLDDTFFILLDLAGIAVSGGSACASGARKASPILEILGFPLDTTTIRFSFSNLNTKEELEYVNNFFKNYVNK